MLFRNACEQPVVVQDTAHRTGFNREKVLYSVFHRNKAPQTRLYTQSQPVMRGHRNS